MKLTVLAFSLFITTCLNVAAAREDASSKSSGGGEFCVVCQLMTEHEKGALAIISALDGSVAACIEKIENKNHVIRNLQKSLDEEEPKEADFKSRCDRDNARMVQILANKAGHKSKNCLAYEAVASWVNDIKKSLYTKSLDLIKKQIQIAADKNAAEFQANGRAETPDMRERSRRLSELRSEENSLNYKLGLPVVNPYAEEKPPAEIEIEHNSRLSILRLFELGGMQDIPLHCQGVKLDRDLAVTLGCAVK
jgi:hypothetical protein